MMEKGARIDTLNDRIRIRYKNKDLLHDLSEIVSFGAPDARLYPFTATFRT